MADVLEKTAIKPVEIRRFELPDLDRHPWLYTRIATAYPHLNVKSARSWLKNILYMNEFNFLYQDRAVALAEQVRPYAFTGGLVVWERFVWCENPIDPAQQKEAAQFYARLEKWARGMDAEAVIVAEQSDVPVDLIRAAFSQTCRLLERKQTYARL